MKLPYTLYVVDDEESITVGMQMALGDFYRVLVFSAPAPALKAMEIDPPDVVLLDIGFPGANGLDALKEIKRRNPSIPVIMITGFEDVKTVVSAVKLGAYEYITKPLHVDSVKIHIDNAIETIRLRKEVESLQERYLKDNIPYFVAESDAIQDVMHLVGKVATSQRTPVLILGETGVGKELIASAIHYRSPRFNKPFVTLNCAAVPIELVESELFGYEKGAFSGANASGKKGLVEAAHGGTLFLDEVGDMNLEGQAKLLRFLEDGSFYKVGSTKKVNVDVRVIAATNVDIEEFVNQGRFRKDLYYRLAVVKIRIPSLNERRDDILPIAKHFLLSFNRELGLSFSGIDEKACRALREHDWTGNVRELRNVMERASLIGEGKQISLADLGFHDLAAGPDGRSMECPPIPLHGIDLDALLSWIDRECIQKALLATEGNESKAASLLGLKLTTFRYRKKAGESREAEESTECTAGNTQVLKGIRLPSVSGGLDLCALQRDVERFYIEEALRVTQDSASKAAALVAMKLSTFHYRRRRLRS